MYFNFLLLFVRVTGEVSNTLVEKVMLAQIFIRITAPVCPMCGCACDEFCLNSLLGLPSLSEYLENVVFFLWLFILPRKAFQTIPGIVVPSIKLPSI